MARRQGRRGNRKREAHAARREPSGAAGPALPGRRGKTGFTLLEVLIAVVVFATVMSALVGLVSQNLARLGESRRELEALRRAEEILRDVELGAQAGLLPEVGTTGDVFEPPDDDLRWEQVVEPYALPLPQELQGTGVTYTVFTLPAANVKENVPGLRLVRVRVFPADQEPEVAEPVTLIVGMPPETTAEDEEQVGPEDQNERENGADSGPRRRRGGAPDDDDDGEPPP